MIGQHDEIAACERLADLSEGVLGGEAFVAVRQRMEALSSPEADGGGEIDVLR